MTETENDQIRRKILELFYQKALNNPNDCGVRREDLKTLLSIPMNLIDLNIFYLHWKKLLNIVTMCSGLWEVAVITAEGMDVIEHKEKFIEQFPFMQVNLQTINGSVYGNAIQAVHSQVIFNQEVADAFNQVFEKLEANYSLSSKEKGETKKNLEILQEELQSKNADLGRIQKSWNWLKQNANWVVPTLTQVILEGIKRFVS